MKSFLDACRLAEPLQLVVEAVGEPDAGVRILHQPFALIGRDPRADVPLEHRLVSRRHAYLQVVEGHAFWIDLESRLGIQAGGRPCKHGWLTRDDALRIGPYELRRGFGAGGPPPGRPPEPPPQVARSYGAEPWPDVALEFLNGPSRSAVWPLNRVVSLVGSAAGCKFRLADPSVSPFHCSLVRTPSGPWVVDLLGGGVEVNHAAVRHAPLAEGDELAVGRYRVRIRIAARPEGLDAAEGSAERPAARALAVSPGFAPPASASEHSRSIQPVTVLPAELATKDLGDSASVLVPLMNQFGLMHQQMMDQFQNAMGMLVEMFGSLQREQMDLIRRELDQLREVTREFQDLKAELASYNQARAEAPAQAPPSPMKAGAGTPPSPSTPSGPDRPAVPGPAPGASARVPKGPGASPGPGRPRPPRPARPEGVETDADVMVWLNRRIATLQEERETRWQKILKLLPGSS